MTAFRKYQGLGNDFVVIDVDDPAACSPERARALCDRHFGIGADGVLVVTPGSVGADAGMRVINADGSQPEMCGNGLRCVALHLALTRGEDRVTYRVATDAGVLSCEVVREGLTADVTIDMGIAKELGGHRATFEGQTLEFQRISTGNPHAIHFGSSFSEAQIDVLGPQVSGQLPSGSNVELARLLPDKTLSLVVWERGVGRTLACGTGACATVAAAALGGIVEFGRYVTVHLPGGDLRVRVEAGSLGLSMAGPAEWVFEGRMPPLA